MRVILAVLVSLLMVPAGTVLANDGDGAPRKGFFDYLDGAGRYVLGDSEGDVRQPYLRDGKIPQNTQWDYDQWRPEHWADDRDSIESVISGFYDADILVRQYEDKVPVLEVGQPFLLLSPIDQRRVIAFVDYAFGITSSKEEGVFYIVIDRDSGMRLLGLYSAHGLQMQ